MDPISLIKLLQIFLSEDLSTESLCEENKKKIETLINLIKSTLKLHSGKLFVSFLCNYRLI